MNTRIFRINKPTCWTFLSVLLLSLQTFGQGHPPFPSVDEVYKNILNNPAVYKSLKEDYKVANPKECKIEKKMIIGSGEIDSDFSTYKSDNANSINWKWPDDRAYTVFRVTTPENTEGVKFVLPLVVEYTRLQNGSLTNSFHYLWWKFDSPYSVVGGKQDALFMELFMANLFKATPAMRESGRSGYPKDLDNMTLITSIQKSDVMDERNVYSNTESVSRTYEVNGDFVRYSDWDNAVIKSHIINGKCMVIAEFKRDKENGKTGDWYFSSFYGGFGVGLRGDKDSGDKKLYKTAGTHGVEAVYKKEKVEVPTPYYAEINKQQFEEKFKQALYNLYEQKEGSVEALKTFIAPGDEEILEGFVSYFGELNDKKVSLREKSENKINVEANFPETIEDGYVIFQLALERKPISQDKNLKAVYKDAGMSKEQLAKGGLYTANEQVKLKVILIDGFVKIATVPVRSKPIPF